MPFTCSAEERQKDAREDAKCFFLPRRRRSADGASLGCTTNFALDVYFALQFYYLNCSWCLFCTTILLPKTFTSSFKSTKILGFQVDKITSKFSLFFVYFALNILAGCTTIVPSFWPKDPHQKTPSKRPQPKVLKQWTQNKSPQPKDP